MEKYGKVILFVTPIFLSMFLLEKAQEKFLKKESIHPLGTMSCLTSEIVMITKNVLNCCFILFRRNAFLAKTFQTKQAGQHLVIKFL